MREHVLLLQIGDYKTTRQLITTSPQSLSGAQRYSYGCKGSKPPPSSPGADPFLQVPTPGDPLHTGMKRDAITPQATGLQDGAIGAPRRRREMTAA